MTWSDVKLAALQTMFSNEGAVLTPDDINQEYINAMPAKANEALQQVASVGRPILKSWQVEVTQAEEPQETAEKLVLPAVDKAYKISLRQYLPRFRCIDRGQVLFDDGAVYDLAEDWRLEGDDVLILPGMPVGVYTIWYRAYPQVITRETPDSEEIDLAPEAVVLLPLYMAAELYKEDDLAVATVLRNEYEDGLEKLRQSYEDGGSGLLSGARRNTTGWW